MLSVALIITTYNWPEALNHCLHSVLQQSHRPNQIIIADDGSSEHTKLLIDSWQSRLPINHQWQADEGFRAARCRNLALSQVESDYVICIDGDMILHPDFVMDHMRFAKPATFVQGSRVLLSEAFTNQLFDKPIHWQWPPDGIEHGVKGNRKNLIQKPWLSRLIGLQRRCCAKNTRTCNMAFWLDDLRAINGFDNRYEGWGREDSDLAWRLVHYGVKRRRIKFSGIALHMYHPEVSRDSLLANDLLLQYVLNHPSYYRCKDGLEEV